MVVLLKLSNSIGGGEVENEKKQRDCNVLMISEERRNRSNSIISPPFLFFLVSAVLCKNFVGFGLVERARCCHLTSAFFFLVFDPFVLLQMFLCVFHLLLLYDSHRYVKFCCCLCYF